MRQFVRQIFIQLPYTQKFISQPFLIHQFVMTNMVHIANFLSIQIDEVGKRTSKSNTL